APERVVDARGTGEQGEGPRGAVGVPGPEDLAPRRLQLEHEVDGLFDGGPQVLEEAAVVGGQVVVPDTGGRVGAHVGVELGVLDAAVDVVVVPGAVPELGRGQPFVGPLGL